LKYFLQCPRSFPLMGLLLCWRGLEFQHTPSFVFSCLPSPGVDLKIGSELSTSVSQSLYQLCKFLFVFLRMLLSKPLSGPKTLNVLSPISSLHSEYFVLVFPVVALTLSSEFFFLSRDLVLHPPNYLFFSCTTPGCDYCGWEFLFFFFIASRSPVVSMGFCL